MSGQATGWVLRNGPRDRAMRAVLVTIADAANRDGGHAHPGIPAMVEGSGYSRRHVFTALKNLLAEGWIGIEEEGGRGPGAATIYCLNMAEIVQPVHPSETRESAERVQRECTEGAVSCIDPIYPTLTSTPTSEPSSAEAPADTLKATADALTRAWWESHDPRPVMKFVAARPIVAKVLERFPETVVRRALARAGPRIWESKLEDLCRGPTRQAQRGNDRWENAKALFTEGLG